jgi:hypothetical protein
MDEQQRAEVFGFGRTLILQMAGEWLSQAGFSNKAQIEAQVTLPGRILLTRVDAGGPLTCRVPLVWIPVEQLAAGEVGHVAV